MVASKCQRVRYLVSRSRKVLRQEGASAREDVEAVEIPVVFPSRAEALGYAREQAAQSAIEIHCFPSPAGTIARSVYQVTATGYDEGKGDWVACTLDGVPCGCAAIGGVDFVTVDALDIRGGVRDAFDRASRHGGAYGHRTLADAMEEEYGIGWDGLDWVDLW